MSSPSSKPKPEETPAEPLYRKPRADVFTMLLVLALLGLLLGAGALYAIMKEYDFQFKGGPYEPPKHARCVAPAPLVEVA